MAQLPVSALIRQGGLSSEGIVDKRKSKDEYRKQKDLEEQRKAGTAPAMVDTETGRDINPHIPEFIEKTPWYVPSVGPSLKHQRPHPERQKTLASIYEWYPKGPSDRVAFKYREGACENCGAMGHRKKDCFERPRAIGAKFTSSEIAPDDNVLPNLNLGYDAKRDRWSGYEPTDFNEQAVSEYEKMEEARKLIRVEKIKDGELEAKEDAVDEDIYADDMAPGQSVDMDSRTRITVRNLRIREDTAKYLYNLNENSAHYDPKSRSMHGNPFENMPGMENESAKFSGENFVRYSGEVAEANEAQVFAWTARCSGIDVHSLAEPTRLEALKKEYVQQLKETTTSHQKELISKYGGEEHLEALPKELLLAQSENYVEYNRKGKVVKGADHTMLKSRYDEDVYPNNHTSVFGSYWKAYKWGYKCCHSFLKNSYCISLNQEELEDDDIQQESPANEETSKLLIPISQKLYDPPKKEENASEEIKESSSASESASSESEDEEAVELREKQLHQEQEKQERDENKRKNRRKKRQRQNERKREARGEGKETKNKRAKLSKSSDEESSSSAED